MLWRAICGLWWCAAIWERSGWSWLNSPTATTPTQPTPAFRASVGAVAGQEVAKLSPDFVSCLPERVLEDGAMVNFRMDGGTVGRLWTSSVAIGRQHGLPRQVFGETGGVRWSQEPPNQLFYMPLASACR